MWVIVVMVLILKNEVMVRVGVDDKIVEYVVTFKTLQSTTTPALKQTEDVAMDTT